MLEKMADFFENRIDGYDEHMLNEIDHAKIFYPFTASCLPCGENIRILDLGCGTGLELEFYFDLSCNSYVCGIDLSQKMLEKLKAKFADKNIKLVQGSYFDIPFENDFDAAVSVESLHHFTKDEKVPLYKKLHAALKSDGYFVLTDYFAADEDQEKLFRSELLRLRKEQGISDSNFYHYDTPLTVAHEIEALKEAGFSRIEILDSWGQTSTLKAFKCSVLYK